MSNDHFTAELYEEGLRDTAKEVGVEFYDDFVAWQADLRYPEEDPAQLRTMFVDYFVECIRDGWPASVPDAGPAHQTICHVGGFRLLAWLVASEHEHETWEEREASQDILNRLNEEHPDYDAALARERDRE